MMHIIKFSHQLEKHNIKESVIRDLIAKIKEIPNYEKLKMSIELTSYVANIIENEFKKVKVDKKVIFITIMNSIFELTDDDCGTLYDQIEYLIEHGKIVKISSLALFGKSVVSFFQKRLLS